MGVPPLLRLNYSRCTVIILGKNDSAAFFQQGSSVVELLDENVCSIINAYFSVFRI